MYTGPESFILNLLLFFIFMVCFVWIPSSFILRILGFLHDEEDHIIRSGITIIFGICLVVLEGLIMGTLHVSYVFLWIIPFTIVLKSHFRFRKIKIFRFDKRLVSIASLIAVCAFLQSFVLLRGGLLTSSGFTVPSLHDTGWNLSIMDSLRRGIPPEHPAESGVILRNNHYFYPLFLTIAEQTAKVGRFDLYFRFAPFMVSVLFGIGIYAFSTIFIKRHFFRFFAVLVGYWGGNFAYLAPLYFGKLFNPSGNSFYADQPFDQLVNPYTVFGFSLILFSTYVLHKTIRANKMGHIVVPMLVMGILFGFKSFGGIVAVGSLCLTLLLFNMIKGKNKTAQTQNRMLFFILAGTFFVFVPVFFLIADIGRSSIMWIPGWLLNQMVTASPFWQKTSLAAREAYYHQIGNSAGVFKIKLIELLIYTAVNFGTRIFGILTLIYFLIRNTYRKTDKTVLVFFIAFIVTLGYLFPLLFNLRFSSFNIIQFTPYAFIILDPLGVVFFDRVYAKSQKTPVKTCAVIGVFALFLFSSPVNIKNIESHLNSKVDSIPADEYAALSNLDDKTDEKSIILIDPGQYAVYPIYTRFLSRRSVYYVHEEYLTQTGDDYEKRRQKVKDFFNSPTIDFLKTEKIDYVYMLKGSVASNHESFSRVAALRLPVFYENKTVIIYKS